MAIFAQDKCSDYVHLLQFNLRFINLIISVVVIQDKLKPTFLKIVVFPFQKT